MSAIHLPLSDPDETEPKFRNYVPKDAGLRELALDPADAGALTDIFEMLKELSAQKDFNIMDDDDAESSVLSLAPKNPNWDLKRDVEKKLARLEHRTQRAIIELIQQRFIQGQQQQQPALQQDTSLADAVNALERAEEQLD